MSATWLRYESAGRSFDCGHVEKSSSMLALPLRPHALDVAPTRLLRYDERTCEAKNSTCTSACAGPTARHSPSSSSSVVLERLRHQALTSRGNGFHAVESS